MKTPVVLVTAALTVAILLAASFLIATGTRGEEAQSWRDANPAGVAMQNPPVGGGNRSHLMQ
jgi:hypothetical protein